MAATLSLSEIREWARQPGTSSVDPFDIVRSLAAAYNAAEEDHAGYELREVMIRLLEHRARLGDGAPVLDALLRQVGLFPYLDQSGLGAVDAIAYEAHRPLDVYDESLVFHEPQAYVYRQLLEGNNVILSAPTSFGKSLIIDALIASGKYRNVVVIVPTIALLDETRRRLMQFSNQFRVITHVSQRLGDTNLFVLTQERLLDHANLPQIDLFVIDEFYKLHVQDDPERSALLNEAFYKLWKGGGQFYFLGPNIRALPQQLPDNFNARFIKTDFSTVAFDVIRVDGDGDDREKLLRICSDLTEPTLVFCRSPRQAREVASWLLSADVANDQSSEMLDASAWVARHFHENWLFGRALAAGIGIHHGRLPRSLAYLAVRAFNEGQLRFLVCTSTLIEGVNTAAKNVIVFDNRIAMKKYDYFTFRNIQGRSGRMFRHFVGRVFLFHEPPPEELPYIDIPVLTQTDAASEALLLQVDPQDLSPHSTERLAPYLDQEVLGVRVLRENSGVAPDVQLEVAAELRRDANRVYPLLAWTGFPTWEQLRATTERVWRLSGARGWTAGVASPAQLAFRIRHLRDGATARQIIDEELRNTYNPNRDDPDETVEMVLEFLRQWPGYRFPRFLMALDRIQRDVFDSLGMTPGDYSFYAAQVEGLFLPGRLVTLDEYGIPAEIAAKLRPWLKRTDDLDELLAEIASLDLRVIPLSEFELAVIAHAREGLR